MTYIVQIQHNNETANLVCSSFDEAIMVKRSFIIWGGMGYNITIQAQ
jgi:hypothetical protein